MDTMNKLCIILFMLGIILPTLSCDREEKGPKSGPLCKYRETPGKVKILNVLSAGDESNKCWDENIALVGEFIPDDPAMVGKFRYPISPV